jgi:hypothetical protein
MIGWTQEEQERDLEDAQTYLSVTTLTIDRCRHESVAETSLWVFDREQIASIKRLPRDCVGSFRWEVTRMAHGQPVARRCERTLLDCIGDVMRYERSSD